MKKHLALTSGLAFLFAIALSAQEVPRFTYNLGAGFISPVGTTGRHLDEGWKVGGGFGINFNKWVGANIDLNYNRFGINGATLDRIGFPDGNVHVFSATLDPIVHLNQGGNVDIYFTGGGGLYHQTQEFTQPSVSTFTAYDPFFGYFYPVAVPTTQILSSYSVNKPGVDAGMGIAFGNKWHGKFFAEARYNRIFLGTHHTDYVPVTFGFRW
jgi:Outer membrane protein beta-barrel domain